jgi:hypothetical protein
MATLASGKCGPPSRPTVPDPDLPGRTGREHPRSSRPAGAEGRPDPPSSGIESARHLPPGVAELLAEGRKIEAIKLYRERTGVGLAEAKAAVEGYAPPGVKPASPYSDDV